MPVNWRIYKVILQLLSPLHIGWRKTGNIQQTRCYVTGRSLWGALTMRLTRDMAPRGAAVSDSAAYQAIGDEVHKFLSFTYFYPAGCSNGSYQAVWPWDNDFRRRFLASRMGTPLSYPQHSAAPGLLHETEFISPRALDTGEPVFLVGYIFEKQGCTLPWKQTLDRLQLGGERGYGWGRVKLIDIAGEKGSKLFEQNVNFLERNARPAVSLPAKEKLLAHACAEDLPAAGGIEPLVGREWCSGQGKNSYAGQHLDYKGLCFTPGSLLREPTVFIIDKFGIWKRFLEKTE